MENNLVPNKDINVIPTLERFLEKAGKTGPKGWWDGVNGQERFKILRNAYVYGASDAEACYFAGISTQQLYYYIKTENPDFGKEKEALKLNPVFNARAVILKAMETNPELAWRYLAKKLPKEFGDAPPVNPTLNNFGVMNTQINQEYFEEPENIDELLEGPITKQDETA